MYGTGRSTARHGTSTALHSAKYQENWRRLVLRTGRPKCTIGRTGIPLVRLTTFSKDTRDTLDVGLPEMAALSMSLSRHSGTLHTAFQDATSA